MACKVKTQIVGDVHGINVKYSLVDVEADKVVMAEGNVEQQLLRQVNFITILLIQ